MNNELLNTDNATGQTKLSQPKGTGGSAFVSPRMPAADWKGGTLPNVTPLVVDMAEAPMPGSITLTSTAVGRLIEFSTDGGVIYFSPTLNVSLVNQISTVAAGPITHIRLTGQANDTWRVR